MIWTRRGFLQACLTAVGALTVFDLPLVAASTQASAPAVEPIWLLELFATAKERGTVQLARAGQAVMNLHMGPNSFLRWVAAPGEEIAMEGLINSSDIDIDVSMVLQQGPRRWYVHTDGTTQDLTREPIRPSRVVVGPPRGSFAEYVKREEELLKAMAA